MRYKKVLIYKRCNFPDSYKSLKKLCLKWNICFCIF